MSEGQVLGLFVGAVSKAPLRAVQNVRALPGQGLEGDRYCGGSGTFCKDGKADPSHEVTLIEAEAIEGLEQEHSIALGPGESRRNILTRGIGLNDLVGCEFTVGEVSLRGIRLCHPCGHLESLTQKGVKDGLRDRGGLRAQILTEGVIRIGDAITALAVGRNTSCA